ncbi:MAG: glutathione S-transferase N-terminal domain-containing protein [Rhodovibrionaceae bacterium]
MQLLFAATSPYVRKVVVLAAETGLSGQIERIESNPWDPEGNVPQVNPLGKVPALILDDGRVLPDSRLICEYLDSLHPGPKMIPERPAERWETLRLATLADGVLDAALAAVIERLRRPEDYVWTGWVDRQAGKIARGCDLLDAEVKAGRLNGEVDIAQITLGCALGYLDLRLSDLRWRDDRPSLASWYETFSRRPSMVVSAPPAV